MTYDLQWINGPAPGDDRDEYDRRARFRVSEPTMAALHHEMERQGMVGHDVGGRLVGNWETKFERSGQIITREELVVALAPSTNNPAPPRQGHMPIEQWRELWAQWLDFLVGAMNYGGFRVDRK